MSARLSDVGLADRSFTSMKGLEMKKYFRNPVTSDDRHTISQLLLNAEKETKECQAEINRLMSRIHSLENRQRVLNKTMGKYRTLLSPVHRLPTETLSLIFSFVCDWNELLPDSATHAECLSEVSGRWRDVALSTPSSWAAVKLRFCSWKGEMSALNALTSLFMTRSKLSPLKLEIEFSPFDDTDDPSRVIETLSAHSDRWKYLHLHIDKAFAQQQYLFPSIQGKSLPLLEFLRMKGVGRSTASLPASTTLHGLFSLCPALHTIALAGRYACDVLALPWQQIQAVTLLKPRFPVHRNFIFIGRFPNLHKLELPCLVSSKSSPSPATTATPNHIHSPTMRSLLCHLHTQEDVAAAFASITFPMLQSLEMTGINAQGFKDGHRWLEAPCLDFLERSACSLTSLSLKWLPITDQQTISLLRNISTLSSIRIEEAPGNVPNGIVTNHLLQQLTAEHETFYGGSLVPLLKDITFIIRANGLDEQNVFRMVSSRHFDDPLLVEDVGIECLQSVSITVMGGETDEFSFNSLKCFRDSGLHICVSHSP